MRERAGRGVKSKMIKKLFYYAKWFFECRFLGQRKPLQSVIFITDKCNLHCKHCSIVKNDFSISRTYEEIKETLKKCYKMGSRIVDFEGGEPTIWQDNDKNINDLIDLAKKIGYFSTTVTTNAQQPINLKSNLVWISIDGDKQAHETCRGHGTYEKLMENIDESNHSCLNVNMTITKLNYFCVEDVIKMVKAHKKLKKISLSFLTPHGASFDLMVSDQIREEVIDKIIELKKQNYPIMNSLAGLELLKSRKFKPQCWITNFVLANGTYLDTCPGEKEEICENCGYGMATEMSLVFDLNPQTILAGLGVRK